MNKDNVANSQDFSRPPAPDTPTSPASHSAADVGAFKRYVPTRFTVPISFEVPDNWSLREEQGRSYQQVMLLGPRNTQDTYNAGLVVRVLLTRSSGGEYDTLEDLLAWRRTQYTRSASSSIRVEQPIAVAGLQGVELRYEHHARLPKGGSAQGAFPTTIKGHTVLVSYGGQLLELEYSAEAEDFYRYHEAFRHLLESLTLAR